MFSNSVQMSDLEVRDEVLRELRLDSRVRGARIEVAASEGTVTLSGAVASGDEVLAALEAARRAEGVFEVRSEVKVDPLGGKPRTDANIAEAVRRAFEWDVMIPHTQIRVAVSNGWVALSGTVELSRDRENAERLARRLEGVRGVYNLVEVAPARARAENVRDAIEDALRRRARDEAQRIQVSLSEGTVSLAGRVHTWAEKQAIIGAINHTPGVERVNDYLSVDPYF